MEATLRLEHDLIAVEGELCFTGARWRLVLPSRPLRARRGWEG